MLNNSPLGKNFNTMIIIYASLLGFTFSWQNEKLYIPFTAPLQIGIQTKKNHAELLNKGTLHGKSTTLMLLKKKDKSDATHLKNLNYYLVKSSVFRASE